MIMCDQHSEVVRWGLNLLGGDPFSNLGYYETATPNDAIYYNEHYAREDNIDTEHTVVENDEIIAHALQEEFSQLAVAEASGPSHGDQQHFQASVLAQNWLGPSLRTCHSDNEVCREEGGDTEPSTTSTRHSENYYGGGEWSLELADDYSAIDGEVGKRLHQMVAVPHVPRINGEIPSVDYATSDHQRLLDRLRLYDLVELKVLGDGNCQFRALSDQFYRTPEHHKFVRQQVVTQLKKNRDLYEGYVPMAFDDYLEKLSNDGEWGDHVTLQAAADSYGVKIFVITSFKDTCYTEIIPNFPKSKRVIFLSFWAEVHYNSIYAEGDFPTLESKKKKKWWWFGNNE